MQLDHNGCVHWVNQAIIVICSIGIASSVISTVFVLLRAQYFPFNRSHAAHVIIAHALLPLFAYFPSLIDAVTLLPCAGFAFLQTICGTLIALLYCVRGVSLLFHFKVTENIGMLRKGHRNLGFYLQHRSWVTFQGLVTMVLTGGVVTTILCIGAYFAFPPLRTDSFCPVNMTNFWLFRNAYLALLSTCCVVCAWKMRGFKDDGLAIKSELRMLGYVSIFLIIIFMVLLLSVENTGVYAVGSFMVIALLYLFTLMSVWAPIYRSFSSKTRGKYTDLRTFLINSADAYDSFFAFLETEFSTENLLFWSDVQRVRDQYVDFLRQELEQEKERDKVKEKEKEREKERSPVSNIASSTTSELTTIVTMASGSPSLTGRPFGTSVAEENVRGTAIDTKELDTSQPNLKPGQTFTFEKLEKAGPGVGEGEEQQKAQLRRGSETAGEPPSEMGINTIPEDDTARHSPTQANLSSNTANLTMNPLSTAGGVGGGRAALQMRGSGLLGTGLSKRPSTQGLSHLLALGSASAGSSSANGSAHRRPNKPHQRPNLHDQLWREVVEIYDTYVSRDARLDVNISDTARSVISIKMESYIKQNGEVPVENLVTVFNEAEYEVMKLMQGDSYPRYLRSKFRLQRHGFDSSGVGSGSPTAVSRRPFKTGGDSRSQGSKASKHSVEFDVVGPIASASTQTARRSRKTSELLSNNNSNISDNTNTSNTINNTTNTTNNTTNNTTTTNTINSSSSIIIGAVNSTNNIDNNNSNNNGNHNSITTNDLNTNSDHNKEEKEDPNVQ